MKRSLDGFSLLECLVALLIIAGSLSLYQGLTKVLVAHSQRLTQNSQDNWLLFSQQFQAELSGARLDRVEQNRLYVTKQGQSLSYGQFRGADFRRANGQGRGYQPMLYQVDRARFHQQGQVVVLDLVFESGLERTFVYAFPETP